jgi:putative transposase
MARLPRWCVPGCSHHVIQRGNNRQACFFDEANKSIGSDSIEKVVL